MFLGRTSLHRHTCVVLLDLTFLHFYFDLTFPVFFLSSVLMHPEHYTDLDNLDTVENNLRHSAKGSNDAYDVTHSLTAFVSAASTRSTGGASLLLLPLHYRIVVRLWARHLWLQLFPSLWLGLGFVFALFVWLRWAFAHQRPFCTWVFVGR